MVNIGVIGYGYWGPNLVRNFADCEAAARQCPGAAVVDDAAALIADPTVDAVVVATPITSHYELAKAALHSAPTSS